MYFRIMGSLDECCNFPMNSEIVLEAIICVRKICDKLQTMCDGQDVENIVDTVNKTYVTLESCDYLGNNFEKLIYFFFKFNFRTKYLHQWRRYS